MYNKGKRISLKVTHDGATKRVRDAPETIDDLNFILTNMCKDDMPDEYSVVYRDETGDWININDDDDLLLAYDIAHEHTDSHLNIKIKPVKSKKERIEEFKVQGKIDSNVEYDINTMSEKPKKDRGMRLSRGDKQEQRERKQIKRAIIKNIAQDMAKDMMQCQSQQVLQTVSSIQMMVSQASCAHCGVSPIRGIRYKCIECQNFYLCQACEDFSRHPHHLLKMKAPKFNKVPKFGGKENNQNIANQVGQLRTDDRVERGRAHAPVKNTQQGQCWCGCSNGTEQQNRQGCYKVQRGKIISFTKEILNVDPAEKVFVNAEFKNNTHWPLKRGCQLVSIYNDETKKVLQEVKMPLQQIQKMTHFRVQIPLKIKKGAVNTKLGHYVAHFSLQGPMGSTFGETLEIKFKIMDDEIQYMDHLEIKSAQYKLEHSTYMGTTEASEADLMERD